ncbi:TerD family protein [Actinocorallia lasiicapitis]
MVVEGLILRKTWRVVVPSGAVGDGGAAVRRLDSALMSVGFKLSRGLVEALSGMRERDVYSVAEFVLDAVRREVGDHVQHNVYFRDFPAQVPDTFEFWRECVLRALLVHEKDAAELFGTGGVNLLALPDYGRYLHSYDAMVAAHDTFVAAGSERVTVLHLGGSVEDEARELYLRLAGSAVPLSADDLDGLKILADVCDDVEQPAEIPVRENRAVINTVRVMTGRPLLADTVTDVLRVAALLCGGDVTLETPTRFRTLPRGVRRTLLETLDRIIGRTPAKLGDVTMRREQWKRLGERLHPHEYPRWPHAQRVFAVARGTERAPSFASRVEQAFGSGGTTGAVGVLRASPGTLFRTLDRLLREAADEEETLLVLEAVATAVREVSGRVVLSVREHLQNRATAPTAQRIFVNRTGGAWTVPDARGPLPADAVETLLDLFDEEITRRLPVVGPITHDPDVLGVALPLSGKAAGSGLGVLPRGSVTPVGDRHDVLRFFVHWRQAEHTTDLDLGALMLDRSFGDPERADWTNLTGTGFVHSGDITEAPEGASEFIDVALAKVRHPVLVPQVLVYSGERFDRLAESFFGFMLRDSRPGIGDVASGLPFEPATVRMKSELRGSGGTAIPLVFLRAPDGSWTATWLNLFPRGRDFSTVQGRSVSASMQVKGIVERDYVTVGHLLGLLAAKSAPDAPPVHIGLSRPDGLPEGTRVYTPENLGALIPA